MSDADALEGWLVVARRDWQRVQVLLAVDDGPGAGLFLQQALEKYLKGYLIGHGWRLRKIHALQRLLDAASVSNAALAPFRPLCERVSSYYLLERYPHVGLEGPDTARVRIDVDEARSLARALFPDESL